jgi:hypothetical protein
MKKYLVFYGNEFYPNEAMDDFIGDFDTIDEAVERIRNENIEKDKGSMDYNWGLVYDTETRKYVYIEGSYSSFSSL